MDIKWKQNNVTSNKDFLKELIEKFVRHPDKCNELGNVKYLTKQIDSTEFKKLEYLAEELCIDVLTDAVAILNSKQNDKYFVEIKEDYYLNDNQNLLEWPSMKYFDLNKFRLLLSCYISKWKLSPGIKFCIQYQSSRTVNISLLHDFLIIFSIPTKSCPNPQVVAYVYFTVESCSCIPDIEPIFVRYKFEQYFNTYTANCDFDFQDMLIKLILISKSRFYEALFN